VTQYAKLYDDDGNLVREMPVDEQYIWLCDLTPRSDSDEQPERRHRMWRDWGLCDAAVITAGGFWRPITQEDADGRSKHAVIKYFDDKPHIWNGYPRRYFGAEWRFSQDDDLDAASWHVNPQALPKEFNTLQRQWDRLAAQAIKMVQDLQTEGDALKRRALLAKFVERENVRHPLMAGFVLLLSEFCSNSLDMDGAKRQRAVATIMNKIETIHAFMWEKYERLVRIVLEEQKLILDHKKMEDGRARKSTQAITEEFGDADEDVLMRLASEAGLDIRDVE
jgi:hypothetical protein